MLAIWTSYQHYILAASGLTLVGGALLWLLFSEYRRYNRFSAATHVAAPEANRTRWLVALSLIVLAGAFLRIYDIDLKTITHPEVYSPNIDLPADISTPPPRHGFVETLRWHFLAEPHPVGYYMGMWAWTKVFGTSITAIRITSAILGVLSILLVYRIGCAFYNRQVGVLSALLLAANGFHIYWSQIGRMYVPGCFLGLLSVWLLYKIYYREKPDPNYEIAYIITVIAGTSTVIFFWPLLAMQVLWVLFNYSREHAPSARVLYVQTLGLILAAPMWSHIVLMTRQHHADPPTLDFLMNYFSFGFALRTGNSYEAQTIPYAVLVVVVLFALLLLARGLLTTPDTRAGVTRHFDTPARVILYVVAGGVAILMYALSYAVAMRVEALRLVSVLPLLMVLLPAIGAPLGRRLNIWFRRSDLSRRLLLRSPIPMLAIIPTLTIFVVAFWISVIAPRAFTIFIPYLLITLAAGAVSLGGKRLLAILSGIAVAAILLGGIIKYQQTPFGPRDYKTLAARIEQRARADDLFFVKKNDWAVTPMFYYLDHRQLVAENYADKLARHPDARIWTFRFQDEIVLPEIHRSLESAGYVVLEAVTVPDSVAYLYGPPQ